MAGYSRDVKTHRRDSANQSAQANENLKVTPDRYQHYLSTNTDVLKAEDLRITTHNTFNNTSYDSALVTLHLRLALGIL